MSVHSRKRNRQDETDYLTLELCPIPIETEKEKRNNKRRR